MEHDEIRHHCGLFGIYGHPEAVALTHLGLFAQQHRGQESAGICSSDGDQIRRYAGMGLVNEVFQPQHLEQLRNPIAIGHVRYSTTGSCNAANAQPLLVSYAAGQVAVAHNGNLINAARLREEYEQFGHIFLTSSDTEMITHLLAKPAHLEKPNQIGHVLNHLQGAYSLLFLFTDRLVAARDPEGFRPLCIGQMDNGAWVVASETCALDLIGAVYLRDVQPGEVITISAAGLQSEFFAHRPDGAAAQCIFEHIYFADPSSSIFGQNVHTVRVAMGRQLAREAPADGDIVIAVPNCARCAAIGFSHESGIPIERGFTTSHFALRSFILPDQSMRDRTVKLKLNVIKEAVRGRRVIVVEDSVVRGTTTRGKMGALREAGATEVHLRVASPPIRHGCYYGIDFPDKTKLVATDRSVEQIRDFLAVDSLAYLSVEGMLACVQDGGSQKFCTACFTGQYPIPIDQPVSKFALERHQLKMFNGT
ncbi:MAG: Amidophosphoribosyltransferase [Phycisphaerae bacterium]|nr:Amidophosphoribosyltransferase [Phycisphaerae bacterium]